MPRRRSANPNCRSAPVLPAEVLGDMRRERTAPPVDERDADLPGCFVEQARLECDGFWGEWRRVQRVATGRVPVLLMRRRRSRLLLTIAAEDLFALVAAVRAVEDRTR